MDNVNLKAGSIIKTLSSKVSILEIVFENANKDFQDSVIQDFKSKNEVDILHDVLKLNNIDVIMQYANHKNNKVKIIFLLKEDDIEKANDVLNNYLLENMEEEDLEFNDLDLSSLNRMEEEDDFNKSIDKE